MNLWPEIRAWIRYVLWGKNVFEPIELTDEPIELEFDGMYWRKYDD